MKRWTLVLVLMVVPLGLGACTSLRAYPNRSGDLDAELKQLDKFHAPTILEEYEKKPDEAAKQAFRNEVVTARIRAIDLHFGVFQQALFRESVTTNILADWITLGLGGAIATVGGVTTKAALGAVSAGITGAKTSIDKNVYFEKTMPALLAQMIASRKVALARIQEGLTRAVGLYPLNQALIDLEDYYNAGTIPGAVALIIEQAGATAKKADEVQLETRTKAFFAKERVERAARIVDRIRAVHDDKAILLATNLPVQDTEINRIIREVDPTGQHTKKPGVARQVLLMAVSYSTKSEAYLNAWEAALKLLE